jgi:hypothetical protein
MLIIYCWNMANQKPGFRLIKQETKCPPSIGTLVMSSKGPMFLNVVGIKDHLYSPTTTYLGGGLMVGKFVKWWKSKCGWCVAFCVFLCTCIHNTINAMNWTPNMTILISLNFNNLKCGFYNPNTHAIVHNN